MHPYIIPLTALLEQNADPSQAGPMKKYMRDQFEYLGIKSPQVAALLRGYLKQHGFPPTDEMDAIVRDLWEMPQREFQYVAMSLIEKLEKKLPAKSIKTLEYMLTQ